MKRIRDRQKNSGLHAACGRISSKRGMTVAELLITVAIIIILCAVAFISLLAFQRSLAQKERDSIARELFICAQNHLTMARGEGYLGLNVKDEAVTGTKYGDGDLYYFTVHSGDKLSKGENAASMLDLMLPFGSIDETVRSANNYVICYQLKTGTVTDVFYCTESDSPKKFNHTIAADEYTTEQTGCQGALKDVTGKDNADKRRDFSDTGAVLGWYGGDNAGALAGKTKTPSISIDNGDRLVVGITNPNGDTRSLKLLVTGVTSQTKMALDVDASVTEYVLDDITEKGKHFANLADLARLQGQTLPADGKFIPGEDIKVVAVAYSNAGLCNIEYSEVAEANSLYQSISDNPASSGGVVKTAHVSSIRHLENLDPDISNVDMADRDKLLIDSARQTQDLVWTDFAGNTGGKVCTYNATGNVDDANYVPVKNIEVKTYEGLRYAVKEIESKNTGDSGMFEETPSVSVSDLKLIDFNVESTGGSAGALAGKSTGTVKNIVAYDTNKSSYENKKIKGAAAGGLIGTMSSGTVQYCGAAVKVQGSGNAGNAGGLIGNASAGTTVDASFSGGHTENGDYRKISGYDVSTTSGTAGGLIGTSSATVENSYSTCSVDGNTAGGFIGNASGSSIGNCYSTGLVSGKNLKNAFIGSGSPTISSKCWYYEIVNDYDVKKGKDYKGSGSTSSSVVTLESEYDGFVKGAGTWNPAAPYDTYLSGHYKNGGKAAYNLKTATQLKAGSKTTEPSFTSNGASEDLTKYFVNTHYGDWPAPEVFVINN